jgi:hypothetical protein
MLKATATTKKAKKKLAARLTVTPVQSQTAKERQE